MLYPTLYMGPEAPCFQIVRPSVRACVRWLDVTFWFVNGSDVCTSRVASEMDIGRVWQRVSRCTVQLANKSLSLSLWLFVIRLGKLVLLLWHAVTPVVRQDRRTDIIITGIIIVWLRGTRGVVWRHRRP